MGGVLKLVSLLVERLLSGLQAQGERINQIFLSANAYDEFSCKLNQDPYF